MNLDDDIVSGMIGWAIYWGLSAAAAVGRGRCSQIIERRAQFEVTWIVVYQLIHEFGA